MFFSNFVQFQLIIYEDFQSSAWGNKVYTLICQLDRWLVSRSVSWFCIFSRFRFRAMSTSLPKMWIPIVLKYGVSIFVLKTLFKLQAQFQSLLCTSWSRSRSRSKWSVWLTEVRATSTDVWMKEELRSALKHYEIAKNETAKPTYGLTNGPMNG